MLELSTSRRAGRRVVVGAFLCDWCEARFPSFGVATLDDLFVEAADWERLQVANRDMCPDCVDLVVAEAEARWET